MVSACKSTPMLNRINKKERGKCSLWIFNSKLLFQRIANITTTLQYSLEGSFLEGLEQEDVAMLRQCLRTYALIDKIHDAENLFRQHIVKPYMEEVRINLPDVDS